MVVISNCAMPSQSSIAKKTSGKNRKRRCGVKAQKNKNSKKLVKQQLVKEEKKISHFFLPQLNQKFKGKQNLNFEITADDNANNQLPSVCFEKENDSNSSTSTVGFLKMSPYRNNRNPFSIRCYSKDTVQSSLQDCVIDGTRNHSTEDKLENKFR